MVERPAPEVGNQANKEEVDSSAKAKTVHTGEGVKVILRMI